MEERLPRKLAAILYADVVGYSRMAGEDEDATHRRLKESLDLIATIVTSYHGRVINYSGDAALAMFDAVVDAVSCAAVIQRDMVGINEEVPDELKIQFRIGINLGDVIEDGGDIFGDGVNVAARLEGLAEPGGICISEQVYLAISNKLPLEYRDIGAQSVKNIASPVCAYQVQLKHGGELPQRSDKSEYVESPKSRRWHPIATTMLIVLIVAGGFLTWIKPWGTAEEQVSIENMVLSLPDKPSIAVLPFNNLSDDPSQEYFVDGMTEDLITDLAKIERLFVIARNTMFTYKDKSVVVPNVARELGVKYVLEGSVRRVADRVRINAQLIDGASGEHIWAERYDGQLTDIFALQDKVTNEIIGQLKIRLSPDEQLRRASKGTDKPEAHDAYLKGWQLYRRYTPEDFVEAIPFLERATKLDPDYGQAWAALASIYWITYQNKLAWSLIVNPDKGMVTSSSWVGSLNKAEHYLRQAMRNPTPLAYQIESQLSTGYRQFDKALSEAEQAVTLDPNDPEGHQAMAWALIFAGRAEEALTSAEKGMRLDPYYPAPHLYVLGTAHLMLNQHMQAEAVLKRSLGLEPENKNLLLPLASVYGHLGKQVEAQATLKQYEEFVIYWVPKIENYMPWWPFRREADLRLFGSGLINAGLCCEESLEAYIDVVRQGGTLE